MMNSIWFRRWRSTTRSKPCGTRSSEASARLSTRRPNRCDDSERRAQAARLIPTGDLSRDLGKIGLATLGKRSEGFARLAGLQALAKQCAFPSDLSGDPV